MTDKFFRAVEFVLSHEGGYRNDPNDPGGETNFGISRKWANLAGLVNLDIKNLTKDKAVELYKQYFWDLFKLERIRDYTLAAKVFDFLVNAGNIPAIRALQNAVNDCLGFLLLEVDGVLGPATAEAVNAQEPVKLISAFVRRAQDHYNSLCQRSALNNRPAIYLNAWLTGLDDMPKPLNPERN